jgi:hypothetical protein
MDAVLREAVRLVLTERISTAPELQHRMRLRPAAATALWKQTRQAGLVDDEGHVQVPADKAALVVAALPHIPDVDGLADAVMSAMHGPRSVRSLRTHRTRP